tara:strand:+ start:522 stop:4802 length:4281 start_codon:yes stop_codon:yes gene_type:complete
MSDRNNETIVRIAQEAYKQRELALFIGAGMSKGSGLPSWPELITPLAESLGEVIPEDYDANTLIRIVERYEIAMGKAAIHEHVVGLLSKNSPKPNIQHEIIASSDVSTIYTTNYDDLIEQSYRSNNKQVKKVVTARDFNRGITNVIKICGDLDIPDSLVISFKDYNFFETEKHDLVHSLKSDLRRMCVLFIGYSLNDPFLQKFCLEAIRDSGDNCDIIALTLGWSTEDIDFWNRLSLKSIAIKPDNNLSGNDRYNVPVEKTLRRIFQIPSTDYPLSGTEFGDTKTNQSASGIVGSEHATYTEKREETVGPNLNQIRVSSTDAHEGMIINDEQSSEHDDYRVSRLDVARTKINEGKYLDARERLSELLLDPGIDDPLRQRIHFNLALTWHYTNRQARAAEEINLGLNYTGPEKRIAIFRALLAIIQKQPSDVPNILAAYRSSDNDAIRLIAEAAKLELGAQDAISVLAKFENPDLATRALTAEFHIDLEEYNIAEKQLREIIKENDDAYCKFKLGTVISLPIFEQRANQLLPNFAVTRKDRARLIEAKTLFQEAESSISQTDRVEIKLGLWLNLSACASATQDYDEAFRAVEMGSKIAPNDEMLLNNKLSIYGNQKKFLEAAKVAEQLHNIIKTEESLERWTECEFNANNTEHIDSVLANWAKEYPSPSPVYYTIKALHEWRSRHIGDAFRTLQEGEEKHPDNPKMLLEKGKLEAKEGITTAEETLRHALKVADGPDHYFARQQLGLFYFDHGRWDKASNLIFQPDIDEDPLNCPNITEYIACLYNTHRLKECQALLRELQRAHYNFGPNLYDLAARLSFQLNDLGEALRFGRQALLLDSTENRNLLMVELHLKLGQPDLALQEAEATTKQYPESWRAYAMASQSALQTTGRIEATKYALKSVELAPKELNANKALFLASLGTAEASDLTYQETEVIRNSFSFLVDHKDSGIQQVTFDENFTELKSMLRNRSERIGDLRKLYSQHKLPLSMIANHDGSSFHACWGSCIAGDFHPFRMTSGTSEEQKQELQLATNASAVVLDTSALLTLELLNCLDLVQQVFDKVIVPWKVVEVLRAELTLDRHHRANSVMSYKENSYEWLELTSDSYNAKERRFQTILDFIESDTITKTGISPEDLVDIRFSETQDIVGQDFTHAVWNAKNTGSLYYCDDYAVREVARSSENVNGICTQAFLRAAVEKGVLTTENYHRHIAKLIFSNYDFVSENEEVLWQHFVDSDFKIDDLLIKMLGRIHLDHIQKDSAYGIVGAFLGHAWFDLGKQGDGREKVAQTVGDILGTVPDSVFELHSLNFISGILQHLREFPVSIWGCFSAVTSSSKISRTKAWWLVSNFINVLHRITSEERYDVLRTTSVYNRYVAALDSFLLSERLNLLRIPTQRPLPDNAKKKNNSSKNRGKKKKRRRNPKGKSKG